MKFLPAGGGAGRLVSPFIRSVIQAGLVWPASVTAFLMLLVLR